MVFSTQLRKSFFMCLVPKSAARFLLDSHVQHHFSSTVAASSHHPLPAKNSDSIAVFLKENCLSDAQLERVLKTRQQLRFADLEKSVKPKISIFREFGFSDSQIAQIITRNPSILCYSVTNRIRPSLSVLQDLLGSSGKAFKVLSKTWFFGNDLKETLHPNMEFLKSYGLPMERILRLLCFFPTALCIEPAKLRKRVEKLERFGMDSTSRMFIYGIWVVSSMSDRVWELKLQTFKDLGFTDCQILDIFRKTPMVFARSAEQIKSIAAAVLATNIYTLPSIMAHPPCFCYSLEKRLKPRLKLLEILDKRKVIEKWPTLGTVCVYSDERFRKAFVAPYPELLRGVTFPSSGGEKNNSSIFLM